MYTSSNSFLGGNNSGRQGAPQYGTSSFSNAPQGQQQPGRFMQQQTSFGGAPLQTQYTGFPAQAPQQGYQPLPQQTQYTGYPPQNQQAGQGTMPSQQPFQTGTLSQPPIPPQQTGQTSSQIAQSFQSTPAATTPTPQLATKGAKIPKIRLSFLTAQDQAKFEQLFKSAVGDGQSLDGTKLHLGASVLKLNVTRR